MVLAVLERRAGVGLKTHDTYTATVGGVRLTEPAADLAIAVAVASAVTDQPVAASTVMVGEVGLAGEVRRVAGTPRRLAEAARLGFTHAIVAGDPGPVPDGIRVFEADNIVTAINAAFKAPSRG
jgi:DNA repair protein RadA/Sms